MLQERILLTILPPFWPKMPPIGLGYLQSFLETVGQKAQILDLNNLFYRLSEDNLKREWLISCNVHLEENIFSIIKESFPKEYKETIEKLLDYDIIGFSCFKSNFKTTLQTAALLKNRREGIKIILGGPEITRQYFKGGCRLNTKLGDLADFLVMGEGERSLLRYLEVNTEKIARFEQLEDLSKLAFPKYQGLEFKDYPRKDALPLQFSRGCIRRCAFCSERLLYKGFRMRPVANLIEEIRYHREKSKINNFVFFDSMINANPAKLEELCDEIISNFGKINWEAQMAISIDCGDELFIKMKKSGCYNLFVGLESGSDNVLKKMKKGFNRQQAVAFFKKLKSAGLSFGISMIIGYPGETEADFQKSLDFVLSHRNLIPKIEQVNPFVYYEGTEADKNADYKLNKKSVERLEIFLREIKRNNFKYTNAFLGNLIEKC